MLLQHSFVYNGLISESVAWNINTSWISQSNAFYSDRYRTYFSFWGLNFNGRTRDWHVATAEARHVAHLASRSGTRVSGATGWEMVHFQLTETSLYSKTTHNTYISTVFVQLGCRSLINLYMNFNKYFASEMWETVYHLKDAGRHGGEVPRVSLETKGRVVPWGRKWLIIRSGVCYDVRTVTILICKWWLYHVWNISFSTKSSHYSYAVKWQLDGGRKLNLWK